MQFQRALALDPARGVSLLDLAEVRYVQRRSDEAWRLLDSAIAVDPLQARPISMRGVLREAAGDTAGARRDQETALRLSTPSIRAYVLAHLVRLDVASGDSARARGRMTELDRTPILGARVLALEALGMPDSALAVLEREPVPPVDWAFMRWPEFDALRALPRFQRIRDRWQHRARP